MDGWIQEKAMGFKQTTQCPRWGHATRLPLNHFTQLFTLQPKSKDKVLPEGKKTLVTAQMTWDLLGINVKVTAFISHARDTDPVATRC